MLIFGIAFTDIVIVPDVAVAVVIQELLIIEHTIVLPFARAVLEYVTFVAPVIFEPFNFHW